MRLEGHLPKRKGACRRAGRKLTPALSHAPRPCPSLFSSASQHSPDVLSSPTLQVRELSHEGTPRSPSRHS